MKKKYPATDFISMKSKTMPSFLLIMDLQTQFCSVWGHSLNLNQIILNSNQNLGYFALTMVKFALIQFLDYA